jgi:tRNA(Ile)-lysidine synthase
VPSAPTTSAASNVPASERDLTARFFLALKRLGFTPNARAAIAVSGGGDSIALMQLFADWCERTRAVPPVILIVDHALRDGSKDEAAKVKAWGHAKGFEAHILSWKGRKPVSGIEGKAREIRYGLLGEWCAAHDVPNLFVAHTLDDQAETFLLRLGRGSGVDGLSAMKPRAAFPMAGFAKVEVLRPLLEIGRAELRGYLTARGTPWLDDPMNEDSRFARARLRKALPMLEAAGISARRIAEAAGHLARAREALESATQAFLATHARLENPDFALLDASALARTNRETGLRALSALLLAVAGKVYRPRFERLEPLFDSIIDGTFAGARTLSGCRIGRAPKARAVFGPETLLIARESPRKAKTVSNHKKWSD